MKILKTFEIIMFTICLVALSFIPLICAVADYASGTLDREGNRRSFICNLKFNFRSWVWTYKELISEKK
jgi:hypothetical protein